MFSPDNNLTNSDWTKQSWDLNVKTLEQFFIFKGVDESSVSNQRAAVSAFMGLPVFKSAPKSLRDEMARFIDASTKSDRTDVQKFVPTKTDAELAQQRLKILANGSDLVRVPWPVIDAPFVDLQEWDEAVLTIVSLSDLKATSPVLKTKKVAKHIDAMGQALKPFRTYALVVECRGSMIIVDGHHRLMSQWLLGQEFAPIWKVSI